jgi:hypothetical protein
MIFFHSDKVKFTKYISKYKKWSCNLQMSCNYFYPNFTNSTLQGCPLRQLSTLLM